MDVTALLNSSSAAVLQRRDSVGSSTPSATGDTTATSTAVPTPERSPPRRTSGSRSPNRNRTPWDAGGYSLPLTLDIKSIPTFTSSAGRPTLFPAGHSPTEVRLISSSSPKSPKHKFSDSRSSNSSSYTSCSSLSHSRISSLSTVSEFQPTSSSSLSLFTDPDCSSSSSSNHLFKPVAATCHRRQPSLPASLDSAPGQHHRRRRDREEEGVEGSSPKMDPYNQQPPLSSSHQANNLGDDNESPSRPGSPSDALMIRRGQDNSGITNAAASTVGVSYDNGIHEANNASNTHITSEESAVVPYQGDGGSYANTHRRAASAPDPYWPVVVDENDDDNLNDAVAARDQQHHQQHHQVAVPGLVPGLGVDLAALADPSSLPGNLWPQGYQIMFPGVPGLRDTLIRKLLKRELLRPATELAIMNGEIFCMHPGPPCTLDGPKRKAISHLFGRNKKCTRQVPAPVWVHYCRKHYQRSRYRNAHDYSEKQAKLLMQTIHRIQVWSDMQQRDMEIAESEGRPVKGKLLIDWELAERKREKKRKGGKKEEAPDRKRRRIGADPAGDMKRRQPHDQDDQQDDDYDSDFDSDDDQLVNPDDSDGDPNFDRDLAVTGWLKNSLRKGYSTTQILEIALRIRLEIKNKTRSKWPDIEILPNILVRDDEAKPAPKQRRIAGAHKRSKSMGVAMRSSRNAGESNTDMRRRVSQPTIGFGQPEDSYPPPPHAVTQPPRNTGRVVPVFPPYDSQAPYHFGTAQNANAPSRLASRYDVGNSGDFAKFEPRRSAPHHQRSYSEASSHWRIPPQTTQNISDNTYAPPASNGYSGYGGYDSTAAGYNSSGYDTNQRPGFPAIIGQQHAHPSATSHYGASGTSHNAPTLPNMFGEFPPSHFQQSVAYGRPSTSTNSGVAYNSAAKHMRHLSTPITRPHDMSTSASVSLAPLTNVSAYTRASPSQSLNRTPYQPAAASSSGTDYFAVGHLGSSSRSEYQPQPYQSQHYQPQPYQAQPYQPQSYQSQSYQPGRSNLSYGQDPSSSASASYTNPASYTAQAQHGLPYPNDHSAASSAPDISGMTQPAQNSATSYSSNMGYSNYAPRHQRGYSSVQPQTNMPTVDETEGGSNTRPDGNGNGSGNESAHGSGYDNGYNNSN